MFLDVKCCGAHESYNLQEDDGKARLLSITLTLAKLQIHKFEHPVALR